MDSLWAPSHAPGASSFGTRSPIRSRGLIRTKGRQRRTRGRPLWIREGPSWAGWKPLRMLFGYGSVLAGAGPMWSGGSGSGYSRLLQWYRFAGSFLRTTTTHHQCRLSLFSKPQLYFSVSQRTTCCGPYTQFHVWSISLCELYLYFWGEIHWYNGRLVWISWILYSLISCKILDLATLIIPCGLHRLFVPVLIPLEWCGFISTNQHARPFRLPLSAFGMVLPWRSVNRMNARRRVEAFRDASRLFPIMKRTYWKAQVDDGISHLH